MTRYQLLRAFWLRGTCIPLEPMPYDVYERVIRQSFENLKKYFRV